MKLHPPLAEQSDLLADADAQRARRRPDAAAGYSRFPLGGLHLVAWTGARLDVQVLQHVIVDLGGDSLLLQHLLDGLVGSVGSDGWTPLHRTSGLLGCEAEPTFKDQTEGDYGKKRNTQTNICRHI